MLIRGSVASNSKWQCVSGTGSHLSLGFPVLSGIPPPVHPWLPSGSSLSRGLHVHFPLNTWSVFRCLRQRAGPHWLESRHSIPTQLSRSFRQVETNHWTPCWVLLVPGLNYQQARPSWHSQNPSSLTCLPQIFIFHVFAYIVFILHFWSECMLVKDNKRQKSLLYNVLKPKKMGK